MLYEETVQVSISESGGGQYSLEEKDALQETSHPPIISCSLRKQGSYTHLAVIYTYHVNQAAFFIPGV